MNNMGKAEGSAVKDLIEAGHQIMRIENETRMTVALQRPRNEVTVAKNALDELRENPEFAKAAYYSIPYKNEEGGTTDVRGLSIKAAMALARIWGNCSNAGRVIDEREDRLIVEGCFVDCETNLWTMRQISVPRLFWSKRTQAMIPLRGDRLNMAIQSGISKAVRNAILASLPASLTEKYFAMALKIASGSNVGKGEVTDLKKRTQELLKDFEEEEVSREDIARFLGKQTFSEADIGRLQGILNALRDNQVSKDIFLQKPEAGDLKSLDAILEANKKSQTDTN